MRNQDLKVELHQGEIVGATAVSINFDFRVGLLTKE